MLDEAILRPGRLEVQVLVPKPDAEGRQRIAAIHSRRLRERGCLDAKAAAALTSKALAETTDGFSGADLAHVVNEAAIFAVRSQVRLPSSSPQLACPQLVCDTFMVRASSDRIRW